MKHTVGIAIATYNGLKYIEAQLQSILNQSQLPDLISISDDCSNDGTAEYLKEFARGSEVPVRLNLKERQSGVIENFMSAFLGCNTDYIAYCDQDDVWAPHKLRRCSDFLSRENGAALVFHRSVIVDENLNPLGRFEPFNIEAGLYCFPYFPDYLWGFGHQMVFSRSVLPVMTQIKESKSKHIASLGTCFDASLLVAAGMVGDICFLDEPLMQFRRHSKSVSTAGKMGTKEGKESKLDSRQEWVVDRTELIREIAFELANPHSSFAPYLSLERQSAYTRHLSQLEQRYQMRSKVYTSTSRAQRLSSFAGLVASGTYGAVLQNKIPRRHLLVDGLRSLRGGAGT